MSDIETAFFLYSTEEYLFNDFDIEQIFDDELRIMFETYRANMEEALFSVQLPFSFAINGELKRYSTEKHLKNLMHSFSLSIVRGHMHETEKIGNEAAQKTEIELKEIPDADKGQILRNILKALSNADKDETRISNRAVLRQSIVVIWSATESLLRDIVRHTLNKDPNFAASFFESPITAKYWSKKQITFDHIRSYGFDASGKMGDIALEINPCSNIASIRSAFQLILQPESKCHEAINSRELYLLYKLRNIIAHRNAIVDKKYKDETGTNAKIGERLVIRPSDFSKHYLTSKSLAYALLNDASLIFRSNFEKSSTTE